MFDFLKKKLGSWFNKEKEEGLSKDKKKKEKSKKTEKIEKRTEIKVSKQKSKKTEKIEKEIDLQKDLQKLEKELGGKEEAIEEEKEEAIEEEKEEAIEEEKEEAIEPSDKFTQKEEGNFFSKLFKKITTSQLTQQEFDEVFIELELTLLENNVALEAVDKIKESLSKSLVGQQIKKNEAESKIIEALRDSILSVLIDPPNLIENIKKHEGIYTIIFFGINGTGKTTSIAKIANLLKKNNISCVLAAADTFRAASIEQLKTHSERLQIPIIASTYGADPASVAFDAKKYAKANGIKAVLIDTAGRMYTKENLIKEMEKIIRISQPNLKMFVGESITGNDVIDQSKTFNEAIGIDGVILTKADVDEKAGAILSVSHVTKKPIYFLGTGQNYEDLEIFNKKNILKNLGI